MDATDKAYKMKVNGERRGKEIDYYLQRAIRCLNLSEVAPSVVKEVGIESVLLLKEILDRIEIPPFDEIPDRDSMKGRKYKKWTIPKTEITIELVEEGPLQGKYLFTAETVNRLKFYYDRVEHLPYKPGSSIGAYEDFILGAGWMIPGSLIKALPLFFNIELSGQAIWQWTGMLILLISGTGVALLVFHFTRGRISQKKPNPSILRSLVLKMLFPLSLAIITQIIAYLLDEQINFTGGALTFIIFVSEILFFIAMAWVINLLGTATAEWLISKPGIRTNSIDANLIRILSRVTTIVIVFLLLLHSTSDLGIPLTAIFASAGIVGLALALAAKETIANLFGGINILMDRPFRTGDYIILDSGERGEVVEVGLRSTRIITRDDVQIAIPNANITNSKIINESVPKNRFRLRIKVGVAYGSDLDQVEKLLLKIAESNQLVSESPVPRVRIRSFEDSAVEFELLCWAYHPENKGRLMHQLYRSVYNDFKAADIVIPFPQRELHLAKEIVDG